MTKGAIRISLTLCLLLVFGCMSSLQTESAQMVDNQANRESEAKRYLEAVPPDAMFHDMAVNLAATMPPPQAAEFEEVFTKQFDIKAFEVFTLNSLTKHFTAEELHALADFYSSPSGKSAMKKFGVYMADVMPFIQEQASAAMKRYRNEHR